MPKYKNIQHLYHFDLEDIFEADADIFDTEFITFIVEICFLLVLLNALLQAVVDLPAGAAMVVRRAAPADFCQQSEQSATFNFLAISSILDSTSLLCLENKQK